ncbi:MAG TPA: DinB family protein [Bryobacteraceae bacterium]|jgi:hypothetical protein|nr:DinB family protein [Bryobacteraceae bacterium]
MTDLNTRITAAERQTALDRLASSRDLLLRAVAGVSDTQAIFTPEPGRWSILQLVEHLAISDPGLLGRIERGLRQSAQPELMEEVRQKDRRFTGEYKPLPRGVNKAPADLLPTGRYPTLSQATTAFAENRAGTIEFARHTNDELRSHFVPHTLLGPMDCYQWLMACAIHVESHTRQIEELKADPAFPR